MKKVSFSYKYRRVDTKCFLALRALWLMIQPKKEQFYSTNTSFEYDFSRNINEEEIITKIMRWNYFNSASFLPSLMQAYNLHAVVSFSITTALA